MTYSVVERIGENDFNHYAFTSWESLVNQFLHSKVTIEEVYLAIEKDIKEGATEHYNSITLKTASLLTEEDCGKLFSEYCQLITKKINQDGKFSDYHGRFLITTTQKFYAISVYSSKAYTLGDDDLVIWYHKSRIQVKECSDGQTPIYTLKHKDGGSLTDFEFFGQIIISENEYKRWNGINDATVFQEEFNMVSDKMGFTIKMIETHDDV